MTIYDMDDIWPNVRTTSIEFNNVIHPGCTNRSIPITSMSKAQPKK